MTYAPLYLSIYESLILAPNCEPPWKYILLMLYCVFSFPWELFPTVPPVLESSNVTLMMAQSIAKSDPHAHHCR